jgi:moderate conductance mechanosensitive channel
MARIPIDDILMMALRSLLALLLLGAVVMVAAGGVKAQVSADPSAKVNSAISAPQTKEAVRELLSELDDKQVRALLLERMKKEIDRRAVAIAARDRRDLGDIAADYARNLGTLLEDAAAKLPRVPSAFAKAWLTFLEKRGERSFIFFLVGLALCLALGAAGAVATARATARMTPDGAVAGDPHGLLEAVRPLVLAATVKFLPVATFAVAASVVNLLINTMVPLDYEVTGRIIAAISWIGLVIAIARLALAPTLPEWRHCPVASGASAFLVWRIGLAAAVFNIGFGLARWLNQFGSPFNETWFGLWVNLVLHLLLIVTIWQGRHGITSIVAGSARLAEANRSALSAWWPWLMILLIAGHWLVVEVLVATMSVPANLFSAMALTLSVLIGLPIIDHAIRAAVRGSLPVSLNASAALLAAEQATRAGLVRVARVAVAALLSVGLFWLWGLDLVALTKQGMGAQFAGSVINVLLIAGSAYGLWELVRIISDRQIAIEQAALGLDKTENPEQVMEGEGGGAGARLGTILPLVRLGLQIAIAVLATLAILGEIGINILPLLAGAGVVGLAIGFGAQTLVKDIISGIFFLVDDAFRKGEYIDIGSVKGTVEKISLRSMQLRHHNGPLNTIPFGDIRHVTNFSRDWVIMKLTLRLTYDTDAERVRKLIKKLGQEMAEEPNLKPFFLQPLKSQGIIEMQDSAQIMRVKFMTRPGDQWTLRRVVFARIRELFEKEGISFASREVVVRVETPSSGREMKEQVAVLGASAARALEIVDDASADGRKK